MQQAKLIKIVKAIILSKKAFVSIESLEKAFLVEEGVTRVDLKKALEKILKEEDEIYKLVRRAGEYGFELKQEYGKYLQRFNGESREILPRALLETLTIIAYKQPVSRGEIAIIRGVDTHLTVYQQLEERGFIRVSGYGGDVGRAMLYSTTKKFLQYFGLNSLTDLPDFDNSAVTI